MYTRSTNASRTIYIRIAPYVCKSSSIPLRRSSFYRVAMFSMLLALSSWVATSSSVLFVISHSVTWRSAIKNWKKKSRIRLCQLSWETRKSKFCATTARANARYLSIFWASSVPSVFHTILDKYENSLDKFYLKMRNSFNFSPPSQKRISIFKLRRSSSINKNFSYAVYPYHL